MTNLEVVVQLFFSLRLIEFNRDFTYIKLRNTNPFLKFESFFFDAKSYFLKNTRGFWLIRNGLNKIVHEIFFVQI